MIMVYQIHLTYICRCNIQKINTSTIPYKAMPVIFFNDISSEPTYNILSRYFRIDPDILNHNFTTSLPGIIHHKKHRSFTEQIASKINRIGNRLSNISISIS
eukprot:307392_1